MKNRQVIKGKVKDLEFNAMQASGNNDEDIRKRTSEIYPKGETHEDSPEYDWKKSEEDLFSDPGF